MPRRTTIVTRLLVGLALVALAFAADRWAFGFLRAVTLYDHWGEMREWLVALLAAASGSVIKAAAGRERPSREGQVAGHERTVFHGPAMGLHHASCQSFPSGHTLSAFATATSLAAFYPQAAPLFFTVAAATGVNRVVSHQHFLSDVTAGALLGHLMALWLLWRPRIRRLWSDGDTDEETGHT